MKKEDYKVIDNFLSKEDFNKIKEVMIGSNFPWYYNKEVSNLNSKDGIYFTHNFFNLFTHSDYVNILKPILKLLKPKSLIRIKGNLYPCTEKLIKHGNHIDYDYLHKGFIFYINTNNGYTILNDKIKIKSIENRGLFFNAHIKHCSTTCTDQKTRININFNYF